MDYTLVGRYLLRAISLDNYYLIVAVSNHRNIVLYVPAFLAQQEEERKDEQKSLFSLLRDRDSEYSTFHSDGRA